MRTGIKLLMLGMMLAGLAGARATAESGGGAADAPNLEMTPTAEGAIVKTPFYRVELQRSPAGIKTVEWDLSGTGNYRLVAGGSDGLTSAAATLVARLKEPHPAKAGLAQVDLSQPQRFPYDVALREIPLVEGLQATWKFRFRPERFDYEITWLAARDFIDVLELGHAWSSPLPLAYDEATSVAARQTVAEFGKSMAFSDGDLTLRVSQTLNSTPFQAARSAGPGYLAWINMRAGMESAILRNGGRRGGQWSVRGEAAH